jgi:hypothetical protein
MALDAKRHVCLEKMLFILSISITSTLKGKPIKAATGGLNYLRILRERSFAFVFGGNQWSLTW